MFGRDVNSERFWGRGSMAMLLAIGLILQSAIPVAAAVGDLDDTFDGNGKLTLNLSGGDDFLYDILIQPGDQKIVGGGRIDPGEPQWLIARWNPDGSLDSTFGGGDGLVFTNFGTGEDSVSAVALQDDGKIVAVGDAPGAGGRFGVARYNADGTPDATFSGDGRTTTDFGAGYDFAWDVAIQPGDHKIVALGLTGGSDPRFAVVRYNANGSLDTTFSGDGKTTVNLTTGEDAGLALALQPDGKMVLAGYASGAGGQIGLARLRANGSRDTSFSGDGRLTKNLSRGEDAAWDVAIQPGDQKIVLAGRSGAGGGSFAALRYNPNGTPDASFSGDGVTMVNITSFIDVARGMALQPDGKIVLAGTADEEFFAVARLTTSGAIDNSFAHDGTAIVNLTAGSDGATACAIQADNGVVAAGWAAGQGGRIGMIRLLGT